MSTIWDKVSGRNTSTTMTFSKDSDNFWKVIITMEESISIDGNQWETKKIESMALDKDPNNAANVALESVLKKFDAVVGQEGSLFGELISNDNSKVDEVPTS